MNVVWIGDRDVGEGAPVYIIAEAGSNHDRDLGQAKRLIEVAAEAGADAVKFQTFLADRIVAETQTRAKYLDDVLPPGKSMNELFRELELPREWHGELKAYAEECGLDFLSTPFDFEAVALLDELGVKAFKVASYELWHLPLIREIASRGKPIICSTGMANLADVQAAVDTVRATGNEQLILLHCVVNYPPPFSDLNLRAIETMHRAFGVPVGWSDHTPGWLAPVIATALGAAVVEKHFTTDRDQQGRTIASRSSRTSLWRWSAPFGMRKRRWATGSSGWPSRKPTSMSRPDVRSSPRDRSPSGPWSRRPTSSSCVRERASRFEICQTSSAERRGGG